MPSNNLFTPEVVAQLELDLTSALLQQGMMVTSIQLIAHKGSGYSSSVFSVLIDERYHILKVYRDNSAYEREIHHLRREIPLDRFFFVWPAQLHRYHYDIVILEVPEGDEMRSGDLTPAVNTALANCFLRLHSLREDEYVSPESMALRVQEKSISVMAHAADYAELIAADVAQALADAVAYLERHRSDFEVQSSHCHGDPWWGNIIVAAEDVYLIDWEGSKLDDYVEDLAKFRVMIEYERPQEPQSFWDQSQDRAKIDGFMDDLLDRYEEHFVEPNLRGRFGFYCLYLAAVVFGDNFYGDKRGSVESRRIIESGIELFRRYTA